MESLGQQRQQFREEADSAVETVASAGQEAVAAKREAGEERLERDGEAFAKATDSAEESAEDDIDASANSRSFAASSNRSEFLCGRVGCAGASINFSSRRLICASFSIWSAQKEATKSSTSIAPSATHAWKSSRRCGFCSNMSCTK